MKKVLTIMLTCLLIIGQLTACGTPSSKPIAEESSKSEITNSKDSEENTSLQSTITAPGTLPISTEPVVLSAFAVQTAQVENLETNLATLELQERTNITLDLNIVMDNVAGEKRNLMLTSGDFPDIFLSGRFSAGDIATYGVEQEILIPLDNLIEQYTVEIPATEKDIPNFLENIRASDGHIYALPSINECFHCIYPAKMWVNSEWLDQLKLSIPETTTEFRTMLQEFKQDVNQNGIADEIPMTGTKASNAMLMYLMSAFIPFDGSYLIKNNEQLQFTANTNEWRQGLEYINGLYVDGLIDPGAFTQELDQLRQLCNQEEVIVGAVPNLHPRAFLNMDTEDGKRIQQYNAIPPLEGPSGLRAAALGVHRWGSGGNFAITEVCASPEAAIRLADYIYSEEGTVLMEMGPEGSGWEPAKEGALGLDGVTAKYHMLELITGSGHVQNVNWHQSAPTRRTTNYRQKIETNQDFYAPDGYETRLHQTTRELYEPYKSDSVIERIPAFTTAQNEIMAQLGVNLTTYIEQSTVRFITGDMNIETEWDSYLQGLEELGVEEYIATYAEALEMEIFTD